MLRYALTCSCQRHLKGHSNNQRGKFSTSFLCCIQSWLVLVIELNPCGMWVHFCSSCCPKEQPTSFIQSHVILPQGNFKGIPQRAPVVAFPHFFTRKISICRLMPSLIYVDQEVKMPVQAIVGLWTTPFHALCRQRGHVLPLF